MRNREYRETVLEELCDKIADSFSKKELKRMVSDMLLKEFSDMSEEDLNYNIDEYCPHLTGTVTTTSLGLLNGLCSTSTNAPEGLSPNV